MEHINQQKQQQSSHKNNASHSLVSHNIKEITSSEGHDPVTRNRELEETHLKSPDHEQSVQLQAMMNNSSQVKMAAQLQTIITQSPQVQEAAQMQSFLDHSPHMVAQRKQREDLFGTSVQRKTSEEEEVVQGKEFKETTSGQQDVPLGNQENHTGLPDNLKAGVENLSGYSMNDVKVHYNSARPAQLQAHAYAQGSEIHVGAGQEKHLPHEAWHVVQQKQGRVKPTMQLKGKVNINDDDGLEKEADTMGAKAASGEVTSWQKARPDSSVVGQLSNDGPIQRAVGFEFELDTVHTYSKNLFNKEKVLNKKDVLVSAPGFKVEADEMPGHSNLEFVTDAFPETADGGDRLETAVNGISTVIANLSGQMGIEIPASALGIGTATANRFLRPNAGMLIGKPQVTAGIKLDMLSRMLDDMAYQAGHGNGNTNAKTFFGGQMAPSTGVRDVHSAGEGMLDVSQAIAATMNALQYVHGIVQADPTIPVIGGPELKALVTQLAMYLAQGAIGLQGYGKLIAGGLMSRTDFATVFNLLPQDKLDYFRDFPDMFTLLVLHAARGAANAVGYHGAMSKNDPVFEGGLYLNQVMFGNNPAVPKGMPNLKRESWLLGIVGGTDQLTSVSFPGGGKKEKAEIESLGSYGNKMDNVNDQPLLYNTPAPLVELRGLKPIYAHLFPPMAFDLFRYIHIVNTGAHEDMPGHLMNLSAGDQSDIAQDNPNGIALRRQAVQDAMDEIQWW